MLFACVLTCPNEALPNAELASDVHCTMLNGFSNSIRADAVALPGRLTCLAADKLKELRNGESTSGSVRGALPNWFLATALKAARLKYWLSVVLARIRDVTSESFTIDSPGTRSGRMVPP